MDIELNKNFKIIKVKSTKLKKTRLNRDIEKRHKIKATEEDEEHNDFINPVQSKKLKIY